MKTIFLASILILGQLSCFGDEDDDDDRGGGGSSNSISYGQVVLEASNAALVAADPEDCTFSLDIYRADGTCLTPIDYGGRTTFVIVSDNDNSDPNAEARIASTENPDENSEPGEIFGGKDFNLAESDTFIGYNELQLNYAYQTEYDSVSIGMIYERVKFSLKNKYVTMLLVSYGQPFADSEVAEQCSLSADEKTRSRYVNADLLSDMSFQRGDYLFCVKNNESDACSASDYQWFDTDSNELVSTRPSSPRQQTYLTTIDTTSCTRNGDRTEFSIPSIVFAAPLSETFKLYADYSHGENSANWAGASVPFDGEGEAVDYDPFNYYYYVNSSGTTTEGSNISVTLDFDLSDSIYIHGVDASDISSTSLDVLLGKTYTKHNWAFQQKANNNVQGYSASHVYGMDSVTPTISVSGGKTIPTELTVEENQE